MAHDEPIPELVVSYFPAPTILRAFPKAKRARPKTGMGMGRGKERKRWKDKDSGDIFEWDYQHGKVERYNKKGRHLGEYDPGSGDRTKPANPTRSITPTIWKERKRTTMVYYLTWFKKEGDDFIVGETLLPDVGESEVRTVFELESDEPPGDCINVNQDHIKWLSEKAKGIDVRLDLFEYFVEACQP